MDEQMDVKPYFDESQKKNNLGTGENDGIDDAQPSCTAGVSATSPPPSEENTCESTFTVGPPMRPRSLAKLREMIKRKKITKFKSKTPLRMSVRDKFRHFFLPRAMVKKLQSPRSRAWRRPVPKRHRRSGSNTSNQTTNFSETVSTSEGGPPARPCTIEDCEVIIISDDEEQQPTTAAAAPAEVSPRATRTRLRRRPRRTSDSQVQTDGDDGDDGVPPPQRVRSVVFDCSSDDDDEYSKVVMAVVPTANDGDDDDEPIETPFEGFQICEPWSMRYPDVELAVPSKFVELREFCGIGMAVRHEPQPAGAAQQPPPQQQAAAARPPRPMPVDVVEQMPNGTLIDSQVVLLKNKIRSTVIEYEEMYDPNCLVDMLADRLRSSDLLAYDTDAVWSSGDAADVRDLLMWLVYSMSNSRLNILPLMACLMIAFRSTVETTQLSHAETYGRFKMYINVIKRCFYDRDIQFWRTWLCAEHFLYGCYFVDHVLYSRDPRYRSMERLIKWSKVLAFKWYLRIPPYHVPMPVTPTDDDDEESSSGQRITLRSLTPPLPDPDPMPIETKADKCIQVNLDHQPSVVPSTSGLAPSTSSSQYSKIKY